MRPAFVLAALSIACLGSSAFAAQKRDEPAYKPPPATIVATPLALAIAGFDRDGNMIISRAEFDAGVARTFAFADKDQDGKVSLLELADWAEAALGNRYALPGQFDFDRDGDDSISRDEFVGLFNARFAALDADKDGSLRRSELVSFAAPQPGRGERGRRGGGEYREPRPR